MKLETAQKLVNTLMDKNYTINGKTFCISKLGWSFKGFDKGVKRLGVCIWGVRSKFIGLSRKMTEKRNEKEVEQTILHEIAHAIDIEIRGKSSHDIFWKNISHSIGYKGNRTTVVSNTVKIDIYNWIGICEEHGFLDGWIRKPSNSNKICRKCKKSILIVPITDVRVKELV